MNVLILSTGRQAFNEMSDPNGLNDKHENFRHHSGFK